MAASSISLSSILFSRSHHHHHHHHIQHHLFASPHPLLQLHLLRTFPALQASRRSSPQENDELINDSRKWSQFNFDGYDDDEYDDEEEDEEEDRSLDLLIRFVENIFRKVSKRARKAVRSVLPLAISTKLVGFAVNGLIILSFLWVLKAFLEVICTLGTVVFVSILLIRGVWSGVLYLQEGRGRPINGFDDDDQSAWTGAQPVT
ncbi:protein SHORT HYPOCOTYL IN WHITE LIGHT 1 [Beta vulgaris subsp. vulgaris]|uniref:protein SHORT HYPOCOTYL IN WHITE LIGHT 1 n=1 Tax=Beta vulgaris subsp. vulgaris TaxID=3555 RepID=UPI002037068E|nr:protein SHORT HYPOCOTYL IN WHITE LIGHT 1 [Beta vulgaris subsp. vulgaris]XP_048492604.1 protein SHORT HYPOCOTYL IN WHITE LIGHT 1 [Beta vulgaris subsp. vulgaris]